MIIMKKLSFIILFVSLLFLTACATTPTDPSIVYRGQSESKIFNDGQTAMLKKDYDVAAKHFEGLNSLYPYGKYAQQAQLDLIYSYYKQQDTASSIIAADRYIHLYPRGKNVDYAYYMRGLMNFTENRGAIESYFGIDFAKRDLSNAKQAYADFDRLITYFPHSKYAPYARQHMVVIRNMLARHELYAAQFYYDHEAYIAAANRANGIVSHYQQTPSVPKALVLLVKSYRKLNLPEKANNVLKVLTLNFPKIKVKG